MVFQGYSLEEISVSVRGWLSDPDSPSPRAKRRVAVGQLWREGRAQLSNILWLQEIAYAVPYSYASCDPVIMSNRYPRQSGSPLKALLFKADDESSKPAKLTLLPPFP